MTMAFCVTWVPVSHPWATSNNRTFDYPGKTSPVKAITLCLSYPPDNGHLNNSFLLSCKSNYDIHVSLPTMKGWKEGKIYQFLSMYRNAWRQNGTDWEFSGDESLCLSNPVGWGFAPIPPLRRGTFQAGQGPCREVLLGGPLERLCAPDSEDGDRGLLLKTSLYKISGTPTWFGSI